MSNQGQRQQSVRDSTSTTESYEGDWLALFDQLLSSEHTADGLTNFNGRLKDYCERAVGFRFGSVGGAMNAFAQSVGGVASWNELGQFDVAANPPAKIVYNFERLPNLPSSISFSRASLAWDYQVRQYASGEPTLAPGIGWLLEKNTVNLMQVFNVAPEDLSGVSASGGDLVLVTDKVKLETAEIDLTVHNGNVWLLDNTGVGTESTLQFTTSTVAAVSSHTSSAVVRGSGETRIGATGALGTATPLTEDYQIIEHSYTPGGASSVFEITISAGGMLWVTVPTLEQGDLLTSPVVTEGATGTRIRVLTEESYSRSGAMTMRVSFIPKADTAGQRFVVDLSDGTANNRARVAYSSASTLVGCIVAGVAVNVTLAAPTQDEINTVTLNHDGGTDLRATLNGGAEQSATTSIPDTTDIQYGHDWTGNNILNGYVRSIAIWDADVQAIPNEFDEGFGRGFS